MLDQLSFALNRIKKPLSTLDAFLMAAKFQRRAGIFWLDRLAAMDWGRIAEMFENMPISEMSEISQRFARKVLRVNKDRLLALRGAL